LPCRQANQGRRPLLMQRQYSAAGDRCKPRRYPLL